MTEPPAGSPPASPGSSDPGMPLYKGSELDAARGPGLGCFYVQLVLLIALVIVTPLTVAWHWPFLVSGALLLAILVLLLLTGQTVIFLLRLVAADRGRRRPRSALTRTVGELEDAAGTAGPNETHEGAGASEPRGSDGGVRQ